jgi:transposase
MSRGCSPQSHSTFTTEQLAEARQIARAHHAPYVQVQRAKMMLHLAEHPLVSNRELAELLGVHRNMVSKWRSRWAKGDIRLEDEPRSGCPPTFTPTQIAEIKAVACELPCTLDLPFSRLSLSEMQGYVIEQKVVPTISIGKLWSILDKDAIRPWYHHSWLFPRDPCFVKKANPILDLYQGLFQGRPLRAREYILCFDQKTSIQARARVHVSVPPGPKRPQLVEHEYEREGALNLLALWDVHRGQAFGRCYARRGRAEVEAFLDEALARPPYDSARTNHLILDNCSSQHPSTFPTWIAQHHRSVQLHYLPTHASWLNQIEIFFSIVQRKALTPNNFRDLQLLAERLLEFVTFYNRTARPFAWNFTRDDLEERLKLLG